ncbi:hypothetical protein K439DRAFT_1657824 [Ramaria rubella]|nr:hypothetical protein K439DRAFT_1657824 [Ramaria rubella]
MTEFSTKAISLLSMGSPHFDALWPTIFDVADRKTQKTLVRVSPYFAGMEERAEARRISDKLKKETIEDIKRGGGGKRAWIEYPNQLRLDPHQETPLWYAWGADKAGFESYEQFKDFCAIADVDPAEGVDLHTVYDDTFISWAFLSREGDVSFICFNNPQKNPFHGPDGYVHYFGCTGEREKTLRLEAWFMENCYSEDVCRGDRSYI